MTSLTSPYAAKSSLRANGSRECAPGDRLREAIHFRHGKERMDCFVASAPRNDVSPQIRVPWILVIRRPDTSGDATNRGWRIGRWREQDPRAGSCASGAGLRSYAVDLAANHPGDQPRRDGRRFRNDAADARRPDFDLSFLVCRVADSGRRGDGSFRCPAGFPEPAGRNRRWRNGVRPRHRAGEFPVRTISARRRDIGHADVPDDTCRQAIVTGALWSLVGRDPVDRQYRHAAVVEPAGLCRRSLRLAIRLLDIRRLRCRGRIRGLRPGTATAGHPRRRIFSPFADGRRDPYRPVASSSRPDRLVACLAGGFARAAGILGRPVADGGQGPQPHRSRQ